MAAQMEKNKQLAPYKSNQDLVNGSSAKLSNICASQHVHIYVYIVAEPSKVEIFEHTSSSVHLHIVLA